MEGWMREEGEEEEVVRMRGKERGMRGMEARKHRIDA